MIDLLEIAKKASFDIADGIGYPPEVDAVLRNKKITAKMADVLSTDIMLLTAMGMNKSSIQVLQIICAWYWQMGRLYGQQETMDKFIEEKMK